MLKATILDKKPKELLDSKKIVALSSKDKKRCKELISVEAVADALDSMGFKYKSLDEIDIYNIIIYILDSSKEKN